MISAFATILPALYSEQSLIFFRFCEGSARRRDAKRKKRAAARAEKEGILSLFRASLISCLTRFARRTKKKERLFVVWHYPSIFYLLL